MKLRDSKYKTAKQSLFCFFFVFVAVIVALVSSHFLPCSDAICAPGKSLPGSSYDEANNNPAITSVSGIDPRSEKPSYSRGCEMRNLLSVAAGTLAGQFIQEFMTW